jgi:L-amino acid N-acyltransferase YncA
MPSTHRGGIRVTPISIQEANAFIEAHHRHHKPALSGLFAVACSENDEVRGVAIVGRPVARNLYDGYTAEVTRLCTDGTKNACSMLYAACWRAARALGYQRLVTYTLPEEGGASLRAAGWRLVGQTGGGSWSRPGRPRIDKHPTIPKFRWEAA